MKKGIFILIGLLAASGSRAQMVDALSSLGIQGAIIQKDVQTMRQALSLSQENRLIHEMQRLVVDIRINHMQGYQDLHKSQFSSYSLAPLEWAVGPESASGFFLGIGQVPQSLCKRFGADSFGAERVLLNNVPYQIQNCKNISQIKFIFR